MKRSIWNSAIAISFVATLAACGGGGGSEGTNPFGPGTAGTGPSVADLDLTASSVQLANTPSSKVTVSVAALDGGKRTVAGASVLISVAPGSDAVVTQVTTTQSTTGATTTTPGGTTNASGVATAEVGVGANRSNRSVTILAKSGSITKSIVIQVVGASISSTVSAPVLSPGGQGSIRYRVVDQANNPMVNQAVQVSAVGLIATNPSGATDLNGEFVYPFATPAATGSYSVTASVAGTTNQQTITVQPASTVPPAEGTIISASVSASPSVVSINVSGSTQNRSEIRALFLAANNAPIKNVRARFDLSGDANRIGGSFTAGSETPLYSDSNGIVRVAYIPQDRPSPTNGVTVKVCYAKTDAELVNACPNAAFVSLTVVNDPLGVTIGRDETILEGTLTYIKQYVVSVVDSAGNAKPDVNLSVSVDLPKYYKGYLCRFRTGSGDCEPPNVISGWVRKETATCNSEDLNRNGVLEIGEDLDGDNRLDPGKSDVSVRLLSSKTGVDGLAVLQIEYPRNYAFWAVAHVTVNASGISGTEGRATYVQDPVPAPTAAIQNALQEPAFVVSPYGIEPSCSDPG